MPEKVSHLDHPELNFRDLRVVLQRGGSADVDHYRYRVLRESIAAGFDIYDQGAALVRVSLGCGQCHIQACASAGDCAHYSWCIQAAGFYQGCDSRGTGNSKGSLIRSPADQACFRYSFRARHRSREQEARRGLVCHQWQQQRLHVRIDQDLLQTDQLASDGTRRQPFRAGGQGSVVSGTQESLGGHRRSGNSQPRSG